MRLLASLLAVALAVAGSAGCGEDEVSSGLDKVLGYLPEDAPFVAAIETDLEGDQFKALGEIADKFPFTGELEEQLKDELEEGGEVDFDRDVKPLLGNELVVGAPDASSFTGEGESDDVVVALQVKDRDELEQLLDRQGVSEIGEQSGATLYRSEDDEDPFAIEDDVFIGAGSRELLEQALEQRDDDGRLTEERFEGALAGLPKDALARVYAELQTLVEEDPGGENVVPWVRALRTFGLTASVTEDEIALDFRLETDPGELSEDDLPIAAGDEAPGVVRREGEVSFGLRDFSQVFQFAEATGRAIDPAGFADYSVAKRQLEQRLGVSLDDDVVAQLTGDVSVSVDVEGEFGVRSELRDPAAFERTLEKLADDPSFAEALGVGTIRKPPGAGGLYTLEQPDGERIVFGVVDQVLVISDDADGARELAAEQPSAVSGAEGSFVLSANAEEIADAILASLGGLSGIAGTFATGPLGDLSGWASADTEGLDGRLTLEID
jgi:hypothetical protein